MTHQYVFSVWQEIGAPKETHAEIRRTYSKITKLRMSIGGSWTRDPREQGCLLGWCPYIHVGHQYCPWGLDYRWDFPPRKCRERFWPFVSIYHHLYSTCGLFLMMLPITQGPLGSVGKVLLKITAGLKTSRRHSRFSVGYLPKYD